MPIRVNPCQVYQKPWYGNAGMCADVQNNEDGPRQLIWEIGIRNPGRVPGGNNEFTCVAVALESIPCGIGMFRQED